MGENQGMMWLVIAGLAVVAGTYQLTQMSNESLEASKEYTKELVAEVSNIVKP